MAACAVGGFAAALAVAGAFASTVVPGVPAIDLPKPSLTPGAVFANATRTRICVAGYASSVRSVPDGEKRLVYARYHVRYVPYAHEVDHLVSLELGGSNAISNLWPEPYAGRWNARVKDKLENRLHDLVCGGRLALSAAQRMIARDWPAAYKRYVGSPAGTTTTSSSGAPSDPGGFYASSYPTASTIYCADDSAWRGLSRTYLQHFASWAQAKAAHPTYHLHQPC